ncbi:MAG: sigma-70 family RNA polymerase sigma factor [Clostridia bacterium]|nr:sigma-70 family RNA polymerase sigma factor [Clostridia bacterium]
MELQEKQTARTPISDEEIVELYWQRDERAISETDVKYKKYLFTIAYNIVHDRPDCEECLNDTYLGAWNAMPPSKPNVLKAFLTAIMRKTAIKRYHRNRQKSTVSSEMTVSLSELEEFIKDEDTVDGAFDAIEFGRVLSGFIRTLPERGQFIFMSRYYAADPIDTIAKNLNLSRSTVNKELAAIRKALKEELRRVGYLI